MARIETHPQGAGGRITVPRSRGSAKVVVVCLWSHKELLDRLQKSCGNLPLTAYPGTPPPKGYR